MSQRSTRRGFLTQSAVAGAAAAALASTAPARAFGANRRVRVGVIGCGGQGRAHIRALGSLADAELAYVCDPDEKRLAKAASLAEGAQAVTDLRRVLDDKTVDAVTIATPDHWHVPAALLAIEAGKHVYVEKPCSHNVREGRLLLDAARRHRRVVQHGTQSRSSPGIQQAVAMLRDGRIGEVLSARCWDWQRRSSIGHAKPTDPPAGVDYDLWVGPAEWLPYQPNRFHYNWHWWYNFGCGDMGNDGIHELDYTLWGLGVNSAPVRISALGGKYFFDDDQQFPDTQQVAFEFPAPDGGRPRMLVYEQRLWSTNGPFNVDAGAEFFGTEGRMFLSKRGKFELRGPRNARVDTPALGSLRPSVADHQQNWIDCIHSGERPRADIEIAHLAATTVHLGNIATRVGRALQFDPASEQIVGDDEANQLLGRSYRDGGHWAIPRAV